MLPVLGHDDWQVESLVVDRGTGLREWFEVRHGDQVVFCADGAELLGLLHSNHLRLEDFVEIEPEDGCE